MRVSSRKGRKFGKINTIKNGDVFVMKSGRKCQVTDYISANNINVEFDCGLKVNLRYGTLREQSFIHPLDRNTWNIGFVGIGDYKPSIHKEAYHKWTSVLERCYDPNFHKTPKGKRYHGVLCCKEWHNFQNFAEWFYSQEYQTGWQIDKDLFSGQVLVYSPDTCVLVPRNINMAVMQGKCGYTKLSGAGRYNKPYQVNISIKDVKKTVGYAATTDEANRMYVRAKKEYIIDLIKSSMISDEMKLRLVTRVEEKYEIC